MIILVRPLQYWNAPYPMEVTLSVTQETTYTVDLHAAGFKWQDWLEAGGVTGSYSSLDDVLADEVALRRLFTVHASVDFLASINDENEDVEKMKEALKGYKG
jgi:hypothetical protein